MGQFIIVGVILKGSNSFVNIPILGPRPPVTTTTASNSDSYKNIVHTLDSTDHFLFDVY